MPPPKPCIGLSPTRIWIPVTLLQPGLSNQLAPKTTMRLTTVSQQPENTATYTIDGNTVPNDYTDWDYQTLGQHYLTKSIINETCKTQTIYIDPITITPATTGTNTGGGGTTQPNNPNNPNNPSDPKTGTITPQITYHYDGIGNVIRKSYKLSLTITNTNNQNPKTPSVSNYINKVIIYLKI